MKSPPTAVDFPLRGEWVAAHTPAKRIPSHGTDALGQRYAYDFVRIKRTRKGWRFFRGSILRYLFVGVKLSDCYCWGEPIHAPFDGTVAVAQDGWPERERLLCFRGLAAFLKVFFKRLLFQGPKKTNDLRSALGNYVILKMTGEEVYALFAHARTGSIKIRENEKVLLGQHIADVGYSGNSTAPHLHFQLMDGANILEAQGLPCRFKEYESFHNGAWSRVTDGIPGMREFVRYVR
ncbi:MAG: M23 family metallopeptidase [Syntrophobacteraceae bacterium]